MSAILMAPFFAAARRAPTNWTFTSGRWAYGLQNPTKAQMSDGNTSSTYFGSDVSSAGSPAWLRADFGYVVFVSTAVIASATEASGGWDVDHTNGAKIQVSSDGTSWTTLATCSGHAHGAPKTYALNAEARYVRVYRSDGEYLGVGDFWFT